MGRPAYWRIPTLLLIVSVWICAASASAEETTDACPDVDRCLQKTSTFLYRYMEHFQKEKYKRCRDFRRHVGDCLAKFKQCPESFYNLSENVRQVIELMDCACISKDEAGDRDKVKSCKSSLDCMEIELSGYFAGLCTDEHMWETEQVETNKFCKTINRLVQCKESLVNSACGSGAATMFTEGQSVVAMRDRIGCTINGKSRFEGVFRYSNECPRDIIQQVDSCVDKFKGELLAFSEENPLLVNGDAEDVRANCSTFRDYVECLDSHNISCPIGIQQVLKDNHELRAYILKMKVICNDDAYASNLQCMQNMQKQNLWGDCPLLATKAQEPLQKLSAVPYYCYPDQSNDVQSFKRALHTVQQCLKDKAKEHCSHQGGHVLSELIQTMFTDPYYLTFGYETDCSLHNIPKEYIQRPTLVTNKPKNKHKNNTKSPPGGDKNVQVNKYGPTAATLPVQSLASPSQQASIVLVSLVLAWSL